MAKNKNKKKRNGATAMDTNENHVHGVAEAMEISDAGAHKSATDAINRSSRVKKGRPMKRSKNVRKMKAVTKAIAKSEQSIEKIVKNEDKASRIQSAKLLYD